MTVNDFVSVINTDIEIFVVFRDGERIDGFDVWEYKTRLVPAETLNSEILKIETSEDHEEWLITVK